MKTKKFLALFVLVFISVFAHGQTRKRPLPGAKPPAEPNTPSSSGNSSTSTPPLSQPKATKAVIIKLKNGDSVTGTFESANAESLTVQVAGNRIVLSLDQVEYANFSGKDLSAQVAPEQKPNGVARALKALNTLAGGTEVGISFLEYSRRLVDARAEIGDALRSEPDSEVKIELLLALEAFADAGSAWNRLIAYGGGTRSLYPDTDPVAERFRQKYQIPLQQSEPLTYLTERERKSAPPGALTPVRWMDQSVVLKTIWGVARKHVERAMSLHSK